MKSKLIVIGIITLIIMSFIGPLPVKATGRTVWECSSATQTCAVATVTDGTITYEGVYTTTDIYAFINQTYSKIICTGTGCTQANDIYVEMTVSVSWNRNTGTSWTTQTNTITSFSNQVQSCGAGTSGSCSYHWYTMIPKASIDPNPAHTYHAQVASQIHVDGNYHDWTITYKYVLSDQPINTDQCDNAYEESALVSSGGIYGNDSVGINLPMTSGQKYKFTVRGGPWYNNGTAQYDIVVSLDGGTTWKLLSAYADLFDCWENDAFDNNGASIILTATASITSFRAKVNDTGGNFADNTGAMQYEFDRVTPVSNVSCGDQYLQGSLIYSGTVQANDSDGVYTANPNRPATIPGPGAWIIIKINDGAWYNGGVNPPLYSFDLKREGGNWTAASGYDGTGCYVEGDTNPQAYVQIGIDPILQIRVGDTDGNFGTNTGSLQFQVYSVTTFDRYPDECEKYFATGNLLYSKTVGASATTGAQVTVPNDVFPALGGGNQTANFKRYWMVEFTGMFLDGGNPLAEADFRKLPASWGTIQAYADSLCTVRVDPVGHYRIYIPVDNGEIYGMRAHDDDYGNNSGTITFNIYEATNYQTIDVGNPLNVNDCDPYYDYEFHGYGYVIQANNSAGVTLDKTWNDKDLLAIVVTDGPWMDGTTPSYQVDISDNGGGSWNRLDNYPSLLCAQSADGDHVLAYIQGVKGAVYKVRVHDPIGNYGNNSGAIGISVYPASTNINPWVSCSSNYPHMFDLMLPDNKIPANLEKGVVIPKLEQGQTYAVKLAGNWAEGSDVLQYGAQLGYTDSMGTTWEDITAGNTLGTCVEYNSQDSELMTIYFTVSHPIYRLRVDDQDSNWINNTGYMTYTLYRVSASDNDSGSMTPQIPPEVRKACYEPCARPKEIITVQNYHIIGTLGGLELIDTIVPIPILLVSDWLEYGRCQLQKYFAVCPEHIQALADIPAMFESKEPFGTIAEVRDAYNSLWDQFDSYDWTSVYAPFSLVTNTGTGGDPTVNNPWGDITSFLPGDSPWKGGQLAFGGDAASDAFDAQAAFRESCNTNLGEYFGEAGTGACSAIMMLRSMGSLLLWIQLLIDARGVALLINYIRNKWVDYGII